MENIPEAKYEGKSLDNWLGYDRSDAYLYVPKLENWKDKIVVKEFSCGRIWSSWQEFGTHKHVLNWVILENGYAVGFNENPSIGWSWPIKKLTKEQFERLKNHNLPYEEYYSNKK